jgi:hypothetical protein
VKGYLFTLLFFIFIRKPGAEFIFCTGLFFYTPKSTP